MTELQVCMEFMIKISWDPATLVYSILPKVTVGTFLELVEIAVCNFLTHSKAIAAWVIKRTGASYNGTGACFDQKLWVHREKPHYCGPWLCIGLYHAETDVEDIHPLIRSKLLFKLIRYMHIEYRFHMNCTWLFMWSLD